MLDSMRRRLGWAVLVLFTTIGFAVGSANQVLAQSGVSLTIEAGHDGRYVSGRALPISVIIESSRALSGDLVIDNDASTPGTDHSIAIEVPAGGKKQYDLIVRPSLFRGTDMQAAIIIDEDELTAQRFGVGEADAPLMGVVADSVPQGLVDARSHPDGEAIRVFAISDGRSPFDAAYLDALSYLLVSQDSLSGLDAAERSELLQWVVSGGRLVIAGPEPSEVDLLGGELSDGWSKGFEGWTPPPDRGVARGVRAHETTVVLGAVTVVASGLTEAGQAVQGWEQVFVAPPKRQVSGDQQGVNNFGSLAGVLSQVDQESLQLPWLAWFLVIYVVIAGPVNYFVLKRRRKRELSWVTIPGLALVFTVGAFALTFGARSKLVVNQASVSLASSQGSAGRTLTAINTSRGGTIAVGFESKDVMVPTVQGQADPEARIRTTGSGSDVLFRASPLTLDLVWVDTDSVEGHLSADLRWDGKGFFGEVTNRTPYDLTDVEVIMGPATARLGQLAPGESGPVALVVDLTNLRSQSFAFTGRFNSRQNVEEAVRTALISTLQSKTGVGSAYLTPMVMGITEQHLSPVTVDGDSVESANRTLVASPVSLEIPQGVSGTLEPVASTTYLSSGTVGNLPAGFSSFPFRAVNWSLQMDGFQTTTVLQRLPDGVDHRRASKANLRIRTDEWVPGGLTGISGGVSQGSTPPELKVEVYNWSAGTWLELTFPFQGSLDVLQEVPAEVISDDGEVVMRVTPEGIGAIGFTAIGVQLVFP